MACLILVCLEFIFLKGKIRIVQNKWEEILTRKRCVFITARPTPPPVYRGMYREAHSIPGIWLASNNIVREMQELEWIELAHVYAREENKWQLGSMPTSVFQNRVWGMRKERSRKRDRTRWLLFSLPLKILPYCIIQFCFPQGMIMIRKFHLQFFIHSFMVHLL